ncbi:MAG: 16S rRNA (uracil(1498)-N(3))-methyltransferase [Candidatus Babeliales bacterium]
MSTSAKHEFAFYYKQLIKDQKQIVLTDAALLQRINKVLRLNVGETFTLFDGVFVIEVVITILDKKHCVVTVQNVEIVRQLLPEVNCIVPVLKRDALEEVLYAAIELGANSVQLMFTEKVHRAWAGTKEFERLHAIMIAACEQSKQFAMPRLHAPITFDEVIKQLSGDVIFFDADGKSAYEVISELKKKKNSKAITLIIGPEADLSINEKDVLRKKGVVFCKLTPTVLRAKQAFVVGLGMIRSMI